jgi:hypothetical protein
MSVAQTEGREESQKITRVAASHRACAAAAMNPATPPRRREA